MHKIVKRRKTAHACESCRLRKSKCDGHRPICGVCRKTGNECHYLVPAKAAQTDGEGALETRLRVLEHTLQDLITQQTSLTKQPGVSPPISPCKPTHIASPSPVQAELESSVLDSGNVDAMGAAAPKEELGKTYFGPTSTSAFLAEINKFLVHRAPVPPESMSNTFNTTAEDYSTTYMSRPSTPTQLSSNTTESNLLNGFQHIEPSSVPSRTEMLHLVDVFFCNSGTLFPFLRKSRVFQICAKFDKSSHHSSSPSEMCILYMVLALASVFNTFDIDAEQKLHQGEAYLQKALVYLPKVMSGTLSLESVQALLLVTKYFQGTRRAGQMWSMLCTSVQTATQIGMYSNPAVYNTTAAEAESRNRTWWMCFQLDRMCSMTFGRPPLIPNSYMRHSLPSDRSYEDLDEERSWSQANKPPGEPSESSLIIHSSKLNFILGDVIEYIYHQNLELTPRISLVECLTEITKVDKQLYQWQNELPQSLKLINADEASQLSEIDRTQRFRIILTLRYHSVRALAHRAILSLVMDSDHEHELADRGATSQQNFSIASLESCLESSVASIEVISSTVLQEDSLPVWWFSIYYIFNSAVNVFALLMVSIKYSLTYRLYSGQHLLGLLKKANTTLGNIKGSVQLRERCCKVLQRLIQIGSLSLQGRASMHTYTDTPLSLQQDYTTSNNSVLPQSSFPDASISGWDKEMLVSDLDPFLLDPLDEDELSWFL